MPRFLPLIALTLLLGCSNKKDDGGQPDQPKGGPSETKPDVTLTAEEFFKEFRADEKATRAKYNGELVEITATVWAPNVSEPFHRLAIVSAIDTKTKFPVMHEFFLDKPDAGKETELRLLTRGQKVTLRGRGTDGPSELGLRDLRIVDSGPTTAVVATLAEVEKALTDPAQKDKYKDRDVLVRVKVVGPAEKGGFHVWSVTDPDAAPGAARFLVRQPFAVTFKKEVEALKVGDTVTVLAWPGGERPPFELADVRIVTSAPAGLTMPGGK